MLDESGFQYPYVDREVCSQCGLCETVCPALNKSRLQRPSHSFFYGCKNEDDSIRRSSSSGGFFYELARFVIDQSGIVFGARFSSDFKKVYHTFATTMDDVKPMMVSKYVQSEVGSSYQDVKRYLNDNRLILFTGTPCQIAGLKAFLGKDYDNLILAEVVCHGVPGPMAWDIYLSGLEMEYGANASYVTFRDKSTSWRNSDFRVEFENGQSFRQSNKDNPYMKSFLMNLNLRESCTRCKFKRFSSGADITMGDFWGSTEMGPSYNDDIGISVVAINTSKGWSLFESVKSNLKDIIELDERRAYIFNESYVVSALKNQNSTDFQRSLCTRTIQDLIQQFAIDQTAKRKDIETVLGVLKRVIKNSFIRLGINHNK